MPRKQFQARNALQSDSLTERSACFGCTKVAAHVPASSSSSNQQLQHEPEYESTALHGLNAPLRKSQTKPILVQGACLPALQGCWGPFKTAQSPLDGLET